MSRPARESAAGLRGQVDRLIGLGKAAEALALLGELWRRDPGPALAGFVCSRFEKLRPNADLLPCRLAVLHSFTVDPAVSVLKAAAAVAGIDLVVHLGDFNTYAQEILDERSSLYSFSPAAVILAVQTQDASPALWGDFADLSAEEVEAEVERVAGIFDNLIGVFRSRSKAHLVVHNLELPPTPAAGILDCQSGGGQAEAVRRVNRRLLASAGARAGVYLLDYDALVGRHGRLRWRDQRKWLTMRMPVAADCLGSLAEEWLRFLCPLVGKVCKALVTDLDNTLWGGVIGEDGLEGIALGPEYPGAAYRALQRAILDLYRRGVILAVCSKNNHDDAVEAISRHPGMLLRPEHFAALRINWNDKAQGLREIAAELNVGTDALAFLDDSPAERRWVRTQMPEVTVIDLPERPLDYAAALRNAPVFERLTLSGEDSQRGRLYAEQRQRAEVKASAASLEDFYRSLRMEVDIATVTRQTLPRVAQLTQKTNQFNMTTRRYGPQEVAEMAGDPARRVYALWVRDAFGDSGLVGVAIARRSQEACELDTFLLSCRVIGRTVETAFLSAVAEQARAEGARKLVGWHLPTKKNAPARGCYAAHGFVCARDEDGRTLWEFDLSAGEIPWPPWIAKGRIDIREGLE